MPLSVLRHYLRRSTPSFVAVLSLYRPVQIGQQLIFREALYIKSSNSAAVQTANFTQCHSHNSRSALAPNPEHSATVDLDAFDGGDEASSDFYDYSPEDELQIRAPSEPSSDSASTSGYGRWESLSKNHARLRAESTPPWPETDGGRLIDSPEGEMDLALWACLLDFCQRTGSLDGAYYLLGELFRRRKLYETDHPLAENFWQTVVDLSIHDDTLLEQLLGHAVWMQDKRDTRWPQLYGSIMNPLLASRQINRAFRWHLLLSSFSAPTKTELIEVLKTAVLDEDQDVKNLLQSIYITSTHRGLYDILVPFFWEQGLCGLALRWRHTFIRHNDRPRSRASRPFIRYFAAYFPQKPLVEQEVRAAGLDTEFTGFEGSAEDVGGDVNALLTFLGGRPLGTDEKYNDTLGARWFASSWISLETAIQFVHALGVSRIGPLSLQSIALREKSTADLVHRLKQLDSCGIRIGASRYVRAIRYMATSGDWNTLQDLLSSDIHPDVFDDDAAQEKIREACQLVSDWKTYRMLTAVRVADTLDGVTIQYNNYLSSADLLSKRVATRILSQMQASDIPLYASTSARISQYILDHMPYRKRHLDPDADYFLKLSRLMLATPYPPPASVWQSLLDSLSYTLDIDRLEEVSLEIVHHYWDAKRDYQPSLRIPTADVPATFHALQPDKPFQTLPRDLPLTNSSHPIAKIFNHRFQRHIVRRAFKSALVRRSRPCRLGSRSSAADYGIARGVKFLADLKNAGVNVPDLTVQKAVILCLVDLFSFDWVPRQHFMTKFNFVNQYTLDEARDLFNEAWGGSLLPATEELQQIIDVEGMARQQRKETRIMKAEERNGMSYIEHRREIFASIARIVSWLERMTR
ncbi:hypothetical protein MCOR25_006425 [Pyricularia grisea]|uniref:Pentatricopeptide repeat domain-containing protein n=1 Tax=Pyricularia grisea TaxID=148305 RepID=A0A6P8B4L9_PYRGI|nr:hypothetical protein PgNI_05961 [Pyricularia grisea]KAI6361681.1 hypothetical protein MCOR25_006425 [Pyricularia grisea]TLD10200.1 hypothetical protein PgNI_05961 [Pyricularia grisea]